MVPVRPEPPLIGSFATLPEAMDAAAEQFGDRDAFVDGDQHLSFVQWRDRADALAAELVSRGVRSGDCVALVLPSGFDYSIAYGAAVRAGAIATGLSLRLGPREMEAILAKTAPALIIADRSASAAAIPDGYVVMEHTELQRAYERSGLGASRPIRLPEDPAVIIWTSGTTGVPKGAWFDHRNLESAVRSAGVMSAPFDRRLVATPFQHAGYMAKIWDQLAWGSCTVISPVPWTVNNMLRIIVDQKITSAGGVPTQWAKLVDLPEAQTADFSHLRLGLVATAPASPELIEKVTALIGCPLIVRYAMTESPSITGTELDDDPSVLYRTVGRPQVGMSVDIVDEHGEPVPEGIVGRVRVAGACVMRGYWGDPELTAAVLDADGRLTSSDLGRFESDGNLVLVGRANDMYIRGGYNVYPLEVENVLAEHPGVSSAGVVGLATAVIGEIGVAFVVPTDPANPPTLDDLRAWVRAHLSDYKAPDRLELLEALPLTAMLKVDKAALVQRCVDK
jgi:acyl-CoA synthetase (AMP-forming)/AMP-acid ligase II